jgi:hypothetical protein
MPDSWAEDPVLRPLLAQGAADPDTLGLILSGSRGAGVAVPDSDYDLLWVLTDDAYERRRDAAPPEAGPPFVREVVDIRYSCPSELSRVAANPGWWTHGYVTARILLDKTGDVSEAVRLITTMPADRAKADTRDQLEGYLNDFCRSVKAWHRGNELGGRLQAAESAMFLVRTLFALAGRWTPYHDRLVTQLDTLSDQGWAPGELYDAVLDLVRTGHPQRQQELERRVEALLRARGYGYAFDSWGGHLQYAKGLTFD